MLLLVTLASVLFVPASWLSRSIDESGLAAFFGCANIAFATSDESYFSPVVELNPFLHAWSLGLEEQFYLVFPLLFYLRSRGKGGPARHALPALALASLALCAFESGWRPKGAYYLLPSRFWELAAGALLFLRHERGRLLPRNSAWANAVVAAGLALVGWGFVAADRSAFPFPWAAPPVLGTLLLICGVAGGDGSAVGRKAPALQRALASPSLTCIGRLSYSLYLWHWPIAALLRWTWGFESPFAKAIYLAAGFAAAAVSYRFVEAPLRRSARIASRRSAEVVGASLAILGIASLAAWRLWEARPALSLSVTKDARVWQSGWYADEGPKEPVTDDPRIRGRKLFAIGDSHVAAYRTMLSIVSRELGIEVREYEEGDCPVAGLLRPMDERTRAHYEKALLEVRALARPGDLVFLPALRMPTFADQFEASDVDAIAAEYLGEEAARDRALALEEARRVVDAFAKTGAFVVMEAPLPVLLAPPNRCSDWFNKMNPVGANGLIVSRSFLERMREPALRSIAELARDRPDFRLWDPFPILCPDEVFSAYDRQGKPLFWDGDHLSGNGNRVLAPSFRAFLEAIWTAPPASAR
jgi:peptidoglycan/LPS O-acetylase OafA/YrhL